MLVCAQCVQPNPDGSKFCNACGTLLEERQIGEERRIVSVLFVDLVGFTFRAEKLDPEDVRAILTPYYEHVREELVRHGGTVEKFIGDAVMGVFGAPTAYGDDAERAVRAAFAVRDWAEQDGLEVRIAVNTGEAIVELEARPGHGEAMVAGDVVNTAARLQSAAPVGAVLVGEETYGATRGSVEYRPAQPVLAKGKSAPVRAWLAVRATAQAGERPQAQIPMIGRDRELAVLTGLWTRVADEGRAQLVTVFGPAGIGKSRLGLELAQLVADEGARVVRGRSTPYGASTPYSAFAQVIKQVAVIFDSDEPVEARSKLASALAELAGPAASEEHAPHLELLLGLEGQQTTADRETLFFSARVFVEALAMGSPTMLIFEDIHWADSSQLDLLEALASRVRDVPVLFVALARPELLTERPAWGGGLPAYTALPLEPLTDGSSRELAEQLLRDSVAERGAGAVVETAEGNPLFIQELAASIVERSTAGELPTSVRAIIAARLDSLPANERSLLVDASVAGRVFWSGALARDGQPRPARRDAEFTRGPRPYRARGSVPYQGRPAVRFQARTYPGRRVCDAPTGSATRATRGSGAIPGRDDGNRTVTRGARPSLAGGWRVQPGRRRAGHGCRAGGARLGEGARPRLVQRSPRAHARRRRAKAIDPVEADRHRAGRAPHARGGCGSPRQLAGVIDQREVCG